MASIRTIRYAMAVLLVIIALPLYAQAPAKPGATPPAAPPGSEPEPKLAFDREVFSYPVEGRRDPFKPLLGGNAGGPLFNDIVLRGIIYSPDARRSVALVQVGGRRTFRLRQGDIIGNARVLEIQPLAVRFAVENFGTIRNETVHLRGNAQPEEEQVRRDDDAAPTAPANREPGVRNERRNNIDPGMVGPNKQQPAVKTNTNNDDGRILESGARR